MVSIVVSHACLALALVLLMIAVARGDIRLAWPPFWPALAAFIVLTILAALASPDPHWAQIRKLCLYLLLPLSFTLIRSRERARDVLLAIAAAGVLSAVVGLVQFITMYVSVADGDDFYQAYVGHRITGFMGHWMTFSGHMAATFLILTAWLLYGRSLRLRSLCVAGAMISALALIASFTRSMWLAATVGVVYLLWYWNRLLIVAVPVVVGVLLAAGPDSLRQRAASIYHPTDQVDSNRHRQVLRAVGVAMLERRPLLGVGPGRIANEFANFYPSGAPRPIPATWYRGHLHNVYLQLGAERGLPALGAFCTMLLAILRDLMRDRRRYAMPSDGAFLLYASTSVILAIMVAGWYEYNAGDSEVLSLLLMAVSCGYAAAREDVPVVEP